MISSPHSHSVSYAVHQAMTLGLPDKADIAFRARIFNKMPHRFIQPIGRQYQTTYKKSGRRNANLILLNIESQLSNETIRLSSSDDELVQYAKLRAKSCARIRSKFSSLKKAYVAISRVVERFGLEPANVGRKSTLLGAVNRMCDDMWWRRRLRKKHKRNSEGLAIQLGLVCKQRGIYASDEALSSRREQKARSSQLLEEMEAVNELDQSYTLKELQDLSVSNPVIRRAELMTRIAGDEQYAQVHGHVGEFYTLTCPSRMHARMSLSGDQNPKYDGIKPNQSHQYLNKQWQKVRAALNRRSIHVYGMRVAEPQHDGTPHWHMLFFMEPQHVDTVRAIMRHYALEIDGNEKGAKEHRFTALAINWSKGTGAGYIAKYISKNIDAHGVEKDLFGNDAKNSALRVDAWASTWGIRQFQQIGGPSVTTWRVLRNLKDIPEEGIIRDAFNAADNGDWCGYVKIMGGHTANRNDWPIGLAKENIDKLNQYGEPIGQVIIGIHAGQDTYRSKSHIWTVRLKSKSTDPYTYTESDPVYVTLRNVTGDCQLDELYTENDSDNENTAFIPIGPGGHGQDDEEQRAESTLNSQDDKQDFLKKGAGTGSGPLEFCQ